MAGLMHDLTKGVGCAADGPQARNPLSSVVGHVTQSLPVGMSIQNHSSMQQHQPMILGRESSDSIRSNLRNQRIHQQQLQKQQNMMQNTWLQQKQDTEHMTMAWRQQSLSQKALVMQPHTQSMIPPQPHLMNIPMIPPVMHPYPPQVYMHSTQNNSYVNQMRGLPQVYPQQQRGLPQVYPQHQHGQQVQRREITQVQDSITDSAAQVSRILQSSEDPRMRSSQLASFMSQISSDEAQKEYTTTQRMEAAWNTTVSKTSSGEKKTNIDEIWEKALQEAKQFDANETTESLLYGNSSATKADVDGGLYSEYSLLENNRFVTKNDSSSKVLSQKDKQKRENDLMDIGHKAFEDGDINTAVLAFQAAVQHRDDNAEAWRMLGVSHAEHDEDSKAIICLERAIERDPYNLEALVALGVSYVNELNQKKALTTLKSWVERTFSSFQFCFFFIENVVPNNFYPKKNIFHNTYNPSFSGLKFVKDEYSDGSLLDEVMQLMLKAQAHSPSDPHVPEVLGVLYNVSRDYDSAIRSFRKALDSDPTNYALWNKLGATKANSSRSEQAMPAYHKALEIKPKYARGWLNLGIAYANVSMYAEAARCYLSALALNPSAVHVWSYLRISFTCLERFDLASQCSEQNIEDFKSEYDIPFL